MSTFSLSKSAGFFQGVSDRSKRIYTLFLITALCWGGATIGRAQSADLDQVATTLEAYHLGQDASVLRDIEKLVANATASPADSGLRAPLAEHLAAVLKSNASDEAKQFACRQLALIGTAEQIPALAELLAKPGDSDMALYALGAIPDPAVERALIGALESVDTRERIGVIDTLGYRHDPQAVAPISRFLDSTEPGTAQAAAAALGKIGGRQAAQLLQHALPTLHGTDHFAAAEGLLRCADRFLAGGAADQAGPIYTSLFAPTEPIAIRAAALRGLVRTGPGAGQFALQALKENDPQIAKAAIGCIQAVPGSDATREFAAELPNLPEAERITLLHALANRGDAAARPAVETLARGSEIPSRVAALEALGRLGDRSTVELLVSAAAEPAPVGPVALASLRSLRADGVDAALTEQVAKAQPAQQTQLIPILASRGATESVPTLLKLAGGTEEETVVESLKALGELAEANSMPTLLQQLVEAQRPAIREAAEEAVVGVASRSASPDRAADEVLSTYRAQTGSPVRASLLRVLSGIGRNGTLEAVARACSDADPAVQEAGVRALSDWPSEAALPRLMTVFDQGATKLQTTLALRGLIRLADLAATQQPPKPTLTIYQRLERKISGPDQARLFLSGLGNVAEPGALPLIEPYLTNEDTREEAAAASLKVATAIAARDPEAAEQTGQSVLKISANEGTRREAEGLLRRLTQNEGFITKWQAAGPFVASGKNAAELFDLPFEPERGSGQSVSWKPISLTESPGQPAVVDLLSIFGGDQRVAYLRTWVHSDQAQPALLELGSDDGVKAWLNGKVVHANNVDRGLAPGQDKVRVRLQAGWNELLLKITQGQGGWAACAQLRGTDGKNLRGLRVDPAHKAER